MKVKAFCILSIFFGLISAAGASLSSNTHAIETLLAQKETNAEKFQSLIVQRTIAEKTSTPEEIIRGMLSAKQAAKLPITVNAGLSAVGDFEVLAEEAATAEGHDSILRYVVLNGVRYEAVVYGRRLASPTKRNIPLRGVVVDGRFILDESAIREVAADEASGENLVAMGQGPHSVYGEVAGKYIRFASREALLAKESEIRAEETAINSMGNTVSQALLQGTSSATKVAEALPASSWTTGTQKILVIRAQFSDLPLGSSSSTSSLQNLMDSQVTPFYTTESFGAATVASTVTTQVYTLANTSTSYATSGDYNSMMTEAKNLAKTDYTLANYTDFALVFPSLGGIANSKITWGGLGYIGSQNFWANGESDFRIMSHELGHNYGLYHTGSWTTSNGDPVSATGSADEYGDPYDVMGSNNNNSLSADFNISARNDLGWISAIQFKTVTTTGVYRLYNSAGDNSLNNTAELLGIKFIKDSTKNYVISFRGSATNPTSNLTSGADVLWTVNNASSYKSLLINAGASGGSFSTAALLPGSTLTDADANLQIQTIAKGGTGTNTYIDVSVTLGGTPPTITTQPSNVTTTAGATAKFSVTSTATSFQWETSTDGGSTWQALVSNASFSNVTTNTLSVAVTALLTNSEYRCAVKNSAGTTYSKVVTLIVSADPTNVIPAITKQPASVSLTANGALTLTVTATGTADKYQWQKNGVNIAGATSATYTIAHAASNDAGSYDVIVTDSAGTTTSANSTVTVAANLATAGGAITTGTSKLINISTRAMVQSGQNVEIAGFIIGGTAQKTVLIRASGPALAQYGLNYLADPQLHIYTSVGNLDVASNDNWEDGAASKAQVVKATTAVGASPFTTGSKDSALVVTLNPGAYTAMVSGANSSSGIALVEVFEVDIGNNLSKPTNLSTRSLVGTNANVQIAGFIISGSAPKKVIVRASGPALTKYGLTGVLADPQIELHDATKIIATNDNWDASTMKSIFAANGVDNWDTGSKDSALITTLQPGAYTVIVTGVGSTSGLALIEVFEAQ